MVLWRFKECSLFSFLKIIVVCHNGHHHYNTFAVYPQLHLIKGMDSLKNTSIEDNQMLLLFRFLYNYTYFKEGSAVKGYFNEFMPNFGWTFIRSGKDIQIQKDGYNCGIYALMFTHSVVMDMT